MKKYLILLLLLCLFSLFVVGVLLYRAYQSDLAFPQEAVIIGTL